MITQPVVYYSIHISMKIYKMVAIDLSKQQALNGEPKAIEHIDFTANLDQAGNATMFFIIEEVKETILDFSK